MIISLLIFAIFLGEMIDIWYNPISLVVYLYVIISGGNLILDILLMRIVHINGRCVSDEKYIQRGSTIRMNVILEKVDGKQEEYQFNTLGNLWKVKLSDVELFYMKSSKILLGGKGIIKQENNKNKRILLVGLGFFIFAIIYLVILKIVL